jgi:PTS system cellobiose-specific IIC component
MASQGGFFGFLEKTVMGPLGKMSTFKVVQGIMAAGMATIPFTIVGSLFLVLAILPQALPFLEGFFSVTFDRVTPIFMVANSATMGVLSLYFALALGYGYTQVIADQEGVNLNPFSGALLALFGFLMTIPMIVFEEGNAVLEAPGWERLGTVGIFTAIILAILSVQLYRLCVKRNWVIKMPEEVPAGVSRAFTALIPAFVVAFVVIILNGLMIAAGTNLFDLVAWPFGFARHLTDNVFGLMFIYFLVHALWLVGIHGANVILPLIGPISLYNMQLNAEGANYVWAGEFANAYVTIGGSGATLGFTLFLIFMAKSKQLNVLGKASIGAGIFNINEPIIFGVPMIYNPLLAIPFFLAPMASVAIGFFAIRLELISPMIANMPWPSPVGLGAFIGTGGDWRAAVASIICAVVAFFIYLPFAKMYDNKLVKEEQANAASGTA